MGTDMNTTSRHRTSNPNALSGLDHNRSESFPHQLYKGAKTQGILTNMPSCVAKSKVLNSKLLNYKHTKL